MSSPILLSIIIFLIMEPMIFSQASNDVFDCLPGEMRALMRFKKSLSLLSNILLSWNNKDCCTWQGVECNKSTGHVIGLDLKNNNLQGNLIGSSLLELKYLSYLDLSFNDFQGSPIPAESIGSMRQLQHLNLNCANFSGVVPKQLGSLSSLRTLNLSGGSYGNLIVDDLMWAVNLSSLEYLDMSYVKLSGTKDLIKVLTMLPSIIDLRMSKSGLDNTNLAHTCVNSTLLANAQHLDLSSNSFKGNCPCFLQNMTSLSFLDLSDNHYSSCDPHFIASTNLDHLSLADNSLHHKADWVYEVMWDKCLLKLLILGGNQLYGDISRAFQNSSSCWSDNLESLDLGLNQFYGNFPEELVNFRALRVLSLYQNRLSGEIPISLGQLSNLEEIYISFNYFNGTLTEAHFANLLKLEYLDAGDNMLKFSVGNVWVPPFQLKYLRLRSTEIGGHFPQWLVTQKALVEIDLSSCSILGTLPKWLHSINLTYLNLSNNQIEQPIPELSYSLESLQLNNNNLTGQLPLTLSSCTRLKVLDVGDNKLSGELTEWVGNNLIGLQVLRLRNNEFYGSIPSVYCNQHLLQMMDLANNNLSGNIPHCFYYFSGMIESRNLSASSDQLLGVSLSEAAKGAMLDYTRTSTYGVNLDLSSNHFTGDIPSELTTLIGLTRLNLSHNHLGGEIPGTIGDMKSLDSLDLSSNNFIGTIPESISKLTFLSHLNLSHNNLSGRIPTGGQLQRFVDPMIYDGNSGLCGAPLLRKCPPNIGNAANDGNSWLCGAPLLRECPPIIGNAAKVTRKKKHVKIIIVGVLSAIVLLISVMALFIILKLRQGKKESALNELLRLEGYTEDSGGGKSNDLRLFTYSSIQSATKNFLSAYKLGQGGFGPVYKGKTSEGQDIAVKLLSRQSGQGLLEFKTELILISQLQHVNLVKLIGFCVHGDDKMIIYDYMPNKSLDFLLFSPSDREKLDWQKRYNIIEGIAQGLLYLHKYSRLKIIHRDLKPSNILLDEKMNPKISDFGLARIFKQDINEANTKRRVGTYGYMAPEYAMQGIFSVKSDVYSFGVLILEIVSGRKNNSFHEIEGPLSLVEYAWELWRKDNVLELMDTTIRGSCIVDQLQRCIHIGLLCVEDHVDDRPTIEDVVMMLKNEMTNWPMPKSPAFITRNSVIEDHEVEKSMPDKLSVNEITVSEIGGR